MDKVFIYLYLSIFIYLFIYLFILLSYKGKSNLII